MSSNIIDSTPFAVQEVTVEVIKLTEKAADGITLSPVPQLSIQPDVGSVDIAASQDSLAKTVAETLLTVIQQAPIISITQSVAAKLWNGNFNSITKDVHIGRVGENALTLGPLAIMPNVLITVESGTLWRII